MFRDKRLRQAYSLTFDRDLFAETYFNIPKFTSQGLPVDSAWSSVVEPDEFAGWWVDPKGKDFGPTAKWYKHDVAEAKKLVSAAGFNSGVTYQSTRAGGNYGPEYDRQIDIMRKARRRRRGGPHVVPGRLGGRRTRGVRQRRSGADGPRSVIRVLRKSTFKRGVRCLNDGRET